MTKSPKAAAPDAPVAPAAPADRQPVTQIACPFDLPQQGGSYTLQPGSRTPELVPEPEPAPEAEPEADAAPEGAVKAALEQLLKGA